MHACGRQGAERDLDGSMMNPMAAEGEARFSPKKESARRGAVRGFPVRSGDSAPPSCADAADPRRAGGCRGRLLLRVRGPGSEWLHDGSGGGGRGQNAFSPKISRCATRERRGGYLAGGKSRMRKELRRPFPMNNTGRAGEASSARATRGAPPCAFTSDSRWIQRRIGARIAFLPVPDAEGQRFAGRRSPGREIPHAPQTRSPRPPKHGKRSGRPACPAIGWKAREAPASASAIVRGSGRLRACGARVTHAICKRHRRYIPMQIFSTAAYLYAEYATADILRKYSLRRSITYAHITHPTSLPPTFLTSHPQSRSHLSSFP